MLIFTSLVQMLWSMKRLNMSTWLGCPDIWSIVFRMFLERVFLDEFNVLTNRWSKADFISLYRWPHPISWRPEWNKKTDLWERGNSSYLWAEMCFCFVPVFRLTLALPWYGTCTGIIPLALVGLQLEDALWAHEDLSASIIVWEKFLSIYHHLSITYLFAPLKSPN